MFRDGIEFPALPSIAANVGESVGDVVYVEVAARGIEEIETFAARQHDRRPLLRDDGQGR